MVSMYDYFHGYSIEANELIDERTTIMLRAGLVKKVILMCTVLCLLTWGVLYEMDVRTSTIVYDSNLIGGH